eukprot:2240453-Pleurochrysis_carterae.AAC.1
MSWLTSEESDDQSLTTYYRSTYYPISLASSISNPDTVTVDSPSLFSSHTVENFTPATTNILPIDRDPPPPMLQKTKKIFVFNEEEQKKEREHHECYVDPVTGRSHCPPKHRSLYHQQKYA